ncbi:MAG TPA: hypothetical protein VH302_14220, partial [Bryobacteraceae bacterium]|nr:hypothetical protein [Bryobacteraceae bacterium]
MIQERTEVAEQHSEMDANPPLGTADLAARAQSDKQLAKSTPETTESAERVALFPENELGDYRRRWQDVQGSFVDDPRIAVRTADELVASLMSRLAQLFADERAKLEHDWDSGENVSTEDLRVALRRYRSFFDRLLS